ncbi:MAG: hypothetical protein KDC61_08510, partial [Saprospiraceae bacterium]|nr:hypothetical protein [Saprospiraceae bacterium]
PSKGEAALLRSAWLVLKQVYTIGKPKTGQSICLFCAARPQWASLLLPEGKKVKNLKINKSWQGGSRRGCCGGRD